MAEARDPVCGMVVDTQDAVADSSFGGTTYYFCSVACRERFEANPTQYTASSFAGADVERHEPPRTTSGPMTSPKFGSAGSGGAEYDPIPEQHDDER